MNTKPVLDPKGYLATPELAAAVDTAITLGMPLLLTGEPGSGKSALAKSIAWEVLGEQEKPLTFTMKSDSRANDLFYQFDTVGRFHAANQSDDGDTSVQRYLHFQALGQAILQAKPYAFVQQLLGDDDAAKRVHSGEPKRSVVLIDEIDKAPRDVPNDILVELEQLCFDVHELQQRVELNDEERQYQPIVIITSNSERTLPEAFLRRCVYHHLQFPPFDDSEGKSGVTVSEIVARRLGRFGAEEALLQQALNWFKYLRTQAQGIERKPSLAEYLNWLEFLLRTEPRVASLDVQSSMIQHSIQHLLLKKPADQAKCQHWLDAWQQTQD